MGEFKKQYCDSVEEQLDSWIEGIPKHNQNCDECCPDFSCCNPELLWDRDKREIFAGAYRSGDHKVCDSMLMESLATLIGSVKPDVYIAGQMPEKDDEVH
jgi:Fe-S-cluster containining protein